MLLILREVIHPASLAVGIADREGVVARTRISGGRYFYDYQVAVVVLDTNPGATIIAGDPRLSVEPVTRYGEPYGPANNRVTVHLVGEQPSRTRRRRRGRYRDCRGRRSSGRGRGRAPTNSCRCSATAASRLRRGRRRRTNLVTESVSKDTIQPVAVAERETSSVAEATTAGVISVSAALVVVGLCAWR